MTTRQKLEFAEKHAIRPSRDTLRAALRQIGRIERLKRTALKTRKRNSC